MCWVASTTFANSSPNLHHAIQTHMWFRCSTGADKTNHFKTSGHILSLIPPAPFGVYLELEFSVFLPVGFSGFRVNIYFWVTNESGFYHWRNTQQTKPLKQWQTTKSWSENVWNSCLKLSWRTAHTHKSSTLILGNQAQNRLPRKSRKRHLESSPTDRTFLTPFVALK
jgi:hypothetical protein